MKVILTCEFFVIQLINSHLSFRLPQRLISLHTFPLNSTKITLLTLQGLAQLYRVWKISLPTPLSSIINLSVSVRTLIKGKIFYAT